MQKVKGMTAEDLSKELNVSGKTVRNHAVKLGFRKGYKTKEFLSPDQVTDLRKSLRRWDERTLGDACPLCGELGHWLDACPKSVYPKVCGSCGAAKSRDQFHLIRPKQGGSRLTNNCKDCRNQRKAETYRTPEGRATKRLQGAAETKRVFLSTKDVLGMLEKQNWECYYTGLPLTAEGGLYGFSMDRKNNYDRTYTLENVVMCCWVLNRMKRTMKFDDFVSLCSDIADNQG